MDPVGRMAIAGPIGPRRRSTIDSMSVVGVIILCGTRYRRYERVACDPVEEAAGQFVSGP